MSAILFGSVSTIADTSEVQREAFNRAFTAHGLSWHWGRDEYLAMLEGSGGVKRIADYASERGEDVDADAVHRTKSELFRQHLAGGVVVPRPGVVETIRRAKADGVKVAFVTTTSPENVTALLEAVSAEISPDDFDAVITASDVDRPKPDKAAYVVALERLGETPDGCVAIEDNLGGVDAARAAGLVCMAFPNDNTAGHDFGAADGRAERLELGQLQQLTPGRIA
jgi:HAD superfamily hydrolase (TIGR01509 family)